MATDFFVSGDVPPVVLKIVLPRSINSLEDLAEVSEALREVNVVLFQYWSQLWSLFRLGQRRGREVRLLSFRVSSPAVLSLFCDPAWLAVFLTIILGYKGAKESLSELKSDIRLAKSNLRGLTDRQLDDLKNAVKGALLLFTTRQGRHEMEPPEVLGQRLEKINKKLRGESGDMPQIEVVRIDDDLQ